MPNVQFVRPCGIVVFVVIYCPLDLLCDFRLCIALSMDQCMVCVVCLYFFVKCVCDLFFCSCNFCVECDCVVVCECAFVCWRYHVFSSRVCVWCVWYQCEFRCPLHMFGLLVYMSEVISGSSIVSEGSHIFAFLM